MQSWFWLSIAVIAEVFATLALKASDGFTKIYAVFIVIIGYSLASACKSEHPHDVGKLLHVFLTVMGAFPCSGACAGC